MEQQEGWHGKTWPSPPVAATNDAPAPHKSKRVKLADKAEVTGRKFYEADPKPMAKNKVEGDEVGFHFHNTNEDWLPPLPVANAQPSVNPYEDLSSVWNGVDTPSIPPSTPPDVSNQDLNPYSSLVTLQEEAPSDCHIGAVHPYPFLTDQDAMKQVSASFDAARSLLEARKRKATQPVLAEATSVDGGNQEPVRHQNTEKNPALDTSQGATLTQLSNSLGALMPLATSQLLAKQVSTFELKPATAAIPASDVIVDGKVALMPLPTSPRAKHLSTFELKPATAANPASDTIVNNGDVANVSEKPEKKVSTDYNEVTIFDVLIGKDSRSYHFHDGNIIWHAHVKRYLPLLQVLREHAKRGIARVIVGSIRKQNGRFLEKRGELWCAIGEEQAMLKTIQKMEDELSKVKGNRGMLLINGSGRKRGGPK